MVGNGRFDWACYQQLVCKVSTVDLKIMVTSSTLFECVGRADTHVKVIWGSSTEYQEQC